jgi:hypothetical protein
VRNFDWLPFTPLWSPSPVLQYVIVMSYDRNDYADTSCPNVPVPHHLPILRCEHRKEAYVKQSRHPSTAARAY